MDPMTIVGILVILVTSFIGTSMGGINFIGILFGDIGSIILVFGGTMGATMASGTLPDTLNAIKALIKSFTGGKTGDPVETIDQLVEFSDRARRDGLLSLEEDAKSIEDEFLRKGIQMAIDGTDPDVVRETLEIELTNMENRHRKGAEFFKTAAGFAPAFGVAGTVIGLISMLNNLTDPSALGPAMALAFITTLWGTFLANYLFIPISNKLRKASAAEVAFRELLLEGVVNIQSGANPRSVADKLKCYLPPAERASYDERKSA